MKQLFENETLQKMAQTGDRLLRSAAELVRMGADSVEELAELKCRQIRLQRAIGDIEEEIALQMQDVGEIIYAAHRGNPSDSDEVQEILEYVDDLYGQLSAHKKQLRELEGAVFCPKCGTENHVSYSYCHACGQPLYETVEIPQQD